MDKERIVVARIVPYPLEEHGGVANNALDGRRYLRNEGIEVYPFGPRPRWRRESLAYPHFGTALWKISRQETKTDLNVATNIAAKRFHRRMHPDIIHVDEPTASLGLLVPLVVQAPKRADGKAQSAFGTTFHAHLERSTRRNKFESVLLQWTPIIETYWGIPRGYRGRLLNILHETFGNRLIAVSHATAQFWEQFYPGTYELLPNGFDTEKFTPAKPAVDVDQQNSKKIVFMAGRHDPRKGFDIGIRAFASLRNARSDIQLVIAGQGQETKKLRKLVSKFDVPDVHFVGFLEEDNLIKAYRAADVFLAPAVGGEGFGRVIAESLACGTPVVASDIEGYREAMSNQPFTQAVAPRFLNGFAHAINTFLDLPEETRTRWQRESWMYVASNFGWSVVAKRQAEVYRKWLREYNEITINGPHGELFIP